MKAATPDPWNEAGERFGETRLLERIERERNRTPKELVDAMQLLDSLPMYAFSGRAVGDAVVMTGVEP